MYVATNRLFYLLPLCLLTAFSVASLQSDVPPDMVLVPGGEYLIGKAGGGDHSPVHKVVLDPFYLDKYEITNVEYASFCTETGHRLPEFWGMDVYHCGPRFPDHPVVGVSWDDAAAYATWAGKRLPTEAEWEVAARGGLVGKNYPHGNDTDTALANIAWQGVMRGTVHIGSYPPNSYGLYDMCGNVVEWVADIYDGEYYKKSPRRNPLGPAKGKFRVIRGGGWHSGPGCCRVFYRNGLPENWVDFNVGFRCARDAD